MCYAIRNDGNCFDRVRRGFRRHLDKILAAQERPNECSLDLREFLEVFARASYVHTRKQWISPDPGRLAHSRLDN